MPRLIFLGTGSILPTRDRFSSGILLERGREALLMDIGPGIIEKLRRISFDLKRINHILITHLHLDHVADLLPFLKIASLLKRRIKIYGPIGIGKWLDLMITDRRIFGYLSDLGCRELVEVHELWDSSLRLDDITIRAKPVEHFNGIAFRIELGDTSITYSGDTLPDRRLIELAIGSKILIHECSFPAGMLKGKHTSSEDIIKIALEVKPRILILVHLYPEMEKNLPAVLAQLSKTLGIKVYAPRDLEIIEI